MLTNAQAALLAAAVSRSSGFGDAAGIEQDAAAFLVWLDRKDHRVLPSDLPPVPGVPEK